jgi:hypothetical protein
MNNRNIFNTVFAGLLMTFSMGVSAQAMHVTPSGNVGVGTMSPAASVDVVRSAAPANFQLSSFTDTAN